MTVIRFPDRTKYHPTTQPPSGLRYYGTFAAILIANLVIFLAAVYGALVFLVDNAFAAATPSAIATQVDARTFILDASSSPCKWRYCTFASRAYGPGYNRLGATIGFGPIVTFVAPNAGTYALVVTESEFCSATSPRACPGSTQVNVTASA